MYIKLLIESGVSCAVIKCGSKGCLIRTGEEMYHVPAYPVKNCIDTTGAGDSFAAGFLWALCEGLPLIECGCFACAVASCTVECMGFTDGVISLETPLSRYNEIKKTTNQNYGVKSMITDSFDNKSEAIISPESFFGEQKHICEWAIATFSREIYPAVLEKYSNEQIGEIRAANRCRPIHLITVGQQKIAFYLSEIGAALAGTDVVEVNWLTGAHKFILFGSAGSLDKEATTGKYVIPTQAYRDEGMSYHYASAADYIDIRNADMLADIFEKLHLPYVKGKVWTTDAIYRETRNLAVQRKSEGCIAVEMEIAGVQAVCDFYGLELYDFLVTDDIVDSLNYTPDGLHQANHSLDKFYVALEIAKRISSR